MYPTLIEAATAYNSGVITTDEYRLYATQYEKGLLPWGDSYQAAYYQSNAANSPITLPKIEIEIPTTRRRRFL